MTTPTTDQPALGLPLGEPETTRRLRALRKGAAKGWWTILPPRNPSDSPNKIVFRVRLAVSDEIRNLPAGTVLDWCLGQADAHGHGAEFTFREGQ